MPKKFMVFDHDFALISNSTENQRFRSQSRIIWLESLSDKPNTRARERIFLTKEARL